MRPTSKPTPGQQPQRSSRGTPGYYRVMAKAQIVSDPAVMLGKPVVAGTRITVELILEKLAAGQTVQQILSAHPRLTEEGIRAALAFAAEALKADVVYPVEKVAG